MYSHSWIRPGFVIAGDGDLDLEETSDIVDRRR